MTVNSKEQAWKEANKLFPTDYEKDEAASQAAGYDVYRHPSLNYYNRICDLGDRLEVLTGEFGENVTNIWIEAPKKQFLTFTAVITYKLHNGTVKTKTMNGVEKVERAFEKECGHIIEVVKVYDAKKWNWEIFAADAIISISLVREGEIA